MKPDPLEELYNSVDPSFLEDSPDIDPRYFADSEWVSQNRKELESYEGKWIAVYEKKILSFGEHGKQVEDEAIKKIGHEVRDLYVEFLEPSHCIY